MKKLSNQSGFSVIETILVFVIVAAIAGVGYFVWHSKQTADKNLNSPSSNSATFKNNAPTDFASCKKAAGSKMLETSPEQCVTKAGKKFTDANIQSPSSPTPTGSASVVSSADIDAAHSAMLADCNTQIAGSNDVCQITGDVDTTNSNFVESQVFAGDKQTDNGHGWAALTKKVDGTWQVIWTGQSCISKATVSKYAIPASIAPDGGC